MWQRPEWHGCVKLPVPYRRIGIIQVSIFVARGIATTDIISSDFALRMDCQIEYFSSAPDNKVEFLPSLSHSR